MFYSRTLVDKHLLCFHCNKRFNTPKVLQCGELICEDCCFNKTEIDCPHCQSTHQVPTNGLPTQRLFQELLQLKAYTTKDLNKVLVTELEQTFNELNQSIETMKLKIDKYEEEIKAHYETLKHGVEKRVNEIILELTDFKRTTFERYENEKQESLKSIRTLMQLFIEESDKKFLEWNRMLYGGDSVVTTEKIKNTTNSVATFLCSMVTQEKCFNKMLHEAKKRDDFRPRINNIVVEERDELTVLSCDFDVDDDSEEGFII